MQLMFEAFGLAMAGARDDPLMLEASLLRNRNGMGASNKISKGVPCK